MNSFRPTISHMQYRPMRYSLVVACLSKPLLLQYSSILRTVYYNLITRTPWKYFGPIYWLLTENVVVDWRKNLQEACARTSRGAVRNDVAVNWDSAGHPNCCVAFKVIPLSLNAENGITPWYTPVTNFEFLISSAVVVWCSPNKEMMWCLIRHRVCLDNTPRT